MFNVTVILNCNIDIVFLTL